MKRYISCQFLPAVLAMVLLGNHADGQDLRQDTAYRFGVAYYLTVNNIDSAIICAKKLNESNAANEKNILLGILYEKKGDTATANSYFAASAGDAATSKPKLHSIMSMVRLHRGDTAGAMHNMRMSVLADATKPKRHFLLGRYYSYKHNTDSALVSYQRAVALDPNNLSYNQALYSSYRLKGMAREAMPYINKYAGSDMLSIVNMLSLASNRIELDSFESAVHVLHRALRVAPTNDTAYYYLGICQLGLGDTIGGLCSLRQSIHLATTPVQAVYDLIIATYEAKGRRYEMRQAIKQAAGSRFQVYVTWLVNSDSARAEIRRIDSLFRSDNASDQLTDLARLASLTAFERDDRMVLNLVRMYSMRVSSVPDSLYLLKARAELNLNKLADAKADVMKVLGDTPSDPIGQALLVAILFKMKDYHAVVTTLLPMSPGVISMDNRSALLFKAYTLLGNTAEAVKYYQGGQ